MFSFNNKGSFKKTESFLKKLASGDLYSDLESFGRMGVDALARATPAATGLTGRSWDYRVVRKANGASIEWFNTNSAGGSNVAILLQYGHGTGTGGYVSGYDYINPAIRPVFDKIATDFWKRVNND